MANWIADHIYRVRWGLLPFLLIVAYILSIGRAQLGFESDYRAYLSPQNPQLQALESMQGTYDKSDNLMIVLSPKSGDIFNTEGFSAVLDTTTRAWQTPYSIRVESIANFQNLRSDIDSITVEDLIAKNTSDWDVEYVQDIALKEPQLVGRLISTDGSVAAVNVTYHLPGLSPYENFEIVTFAHQLVGELKELHPEFDIYLTGMAMYNHAFFESAMADASELTPLVYLVIVLTGLVLFRSLMATVAAVITVYLSVVAAEGAAGWLGMSLTSLSASAPLIILTIGTADAVHVLMSFLKRLRSGQPKSIAIRQGLAETAWPVLLTSLATLVAFLALNFSEVPPFRDLGNIVSLGIVFACMFSLLALPAIFSIIPWKPTQKGDLLERGMTRFGEGVADRSTKLMWVMLPLAAFLAFYSTQNELNDQYLKWFDESMDFRTANDFTQENLTGLYTIEYSVMSNSSEGITGPGYLKDLSEFTAWLRAQDEVMHVSSMSDTFKRINQALHDGEVSQYRLPDSSALAAQSLLLYEQSLPYGLDLNNQVDIDKAASRVVISLKELSTKAMLEFESESLRWLDANTNSISADAASTTLIFAHIGQRNIESMISGITITAFIVSLILMVAFRSWKLGLIALIPNILPAAMAFGVWGMTVGQIGFSLAIVTAMTFGIVVDNTVHFLTGYQRSSLATGNYRESVVASFATTGPAMLVTSIALILGFIVLGSSTFLLNKEMGLATALTLFFALLTDFFLLPGLIKKFMEENDEITEDSSITAIH